MIRQFRLSPPSSGRGVSCDKSGAFVDAIPLLEKSDAPGKGRWRPRDGQELSKQLGQHFAIPIDMSSKSGRLKAIANALNDGDVVRAQIATVLLGIPDPPAQGMNSRTATIKFIQDLRRSGLIRWSDDDGALLKAGYNSGEPRDENGRWTDGQGGEGRLIPAQAIVAEPVIEPLFGEMVRPFPGTIDLVPPITSPRAQNPYPDRPECVEEWAAAKKFCDDLRRRGKLGQDGYRGFGNTYQQCLMGQVSQDCGGNPVT